MSQSAEQYQADALSTIGEAPCGAIFELLLPIATDDGGFTLTYNGQTTLELNYNVDAATMQAALEDLSTIGLGGVKVDGQKKGPYYIELTGENVGASWATLTADGSGLSPAAGLTPKAVRNGRASRFADKASQYWAKYSTITDLDLRALYMTRDLIVQDAMGASVSSVDVRDGDEESKDSQRVTNLKAILADVNAQIARKIELGIQDTGSTFAMQNARWDANDTTGYSRRREFDTRRGVRLY